MSDETRPAFEAEAKAEGQRPRGQRPEAEATISVLAQDPKAARLMAKATAKQIEVRAASEAADANASRKAEAELAHLNRQIAKAEASAERKAKAKARSAKAWAALAQKAGLVLDKVRSEAAASYSAFVYIVVVSVAVFSQREVFRTEFAWGQWTSLGAAVFIEGTGLAFYATSVAMRLDNRSGLIPRLLAWGVTGFAAFMQYNAHKDTLTSGMPLLAYALASASVAALLLAEIRTSHKVGKRLEAADQKDAPQARLGLRFVLRYPGQAWWAISAMIAIPSIRTRSRALRAGRLIKNLRDLKKLNVALMQAAERELKKAYKRGSEGHVLMRLEEFAYYGLRAVEMQNKLASAPATLVKAEAEEAAEAIKAEAALGDPRPRPETRPRVEAQRPKAVAQRPAQPKAEAAQIEAADSEADDEALDLVWAGRPSGLNAWTDRLAELAEHYPDVVPSRATIIREMAERKEAGVPLRHAWTNKGWVTWAMGDLRDLRRAGLADPKPQNVL